MNFDQENGEQRLSGSRPTMTRPALLSLLCILTFIGSGLSAVSYLWIGITLDSVRDMVFNSGLYDSFFAMMPAAKDSMEQTLSLPQAFFLLTGLSYVLSVVGAALMWKLRRIGFHAYTIAQCLIILIAMLMNKEQGFQWGSLIWTILFVGIYAAFLPRMSAGRD